MKPIALMKIIADHEAAGVSVLRYYEGSDTEAAALRARKLGWLEQDIAGGWTVTMRGAEVCGVTARKRDANMVDLTTRELRLLYEMLRLNEAARPAAARERDGDPWPPLLDKMRTMIAARAGRAQWGPVVFAIDLPFDLALTLNTYAQLEGWRRKKLSTALDIRILAEMHKWPSCRLQAPRKRAARVTRYSLHKCDELGVDVIGGKMPIDRIVQAGILAGDTPKLLDREAAWAPAKAKEGKVRVEVFELM